MNIKTKVFGLDKRRVESWTISNEKNGGLTVVVYDEIGSDTPIVEVTIPLSELRRAVQKNEKSRQNR